MNIIDGNGKLIPLKEWQQGRGLKGNKLSDNFTVQEFDCEGELLLSEILIDFLQAARNILNRAFTINSGFRTYEYNKRIGGAKNSPHVAGMACDIDTANAKETEKLALDLIKLARSFGMPLRVGYLQYIREGKSFVHIDVCAKYYGKGKPRHEQPHPISWENGIVW